MLYHYRGFHGHRSKCDLEIVRSSSKTPLVICTELPDNPGTSVTNLAATLATRICEENETIDPGALLWVEHYPPSAYSRGGELMPESWAQVIFTERDGTTFRGPTWYHLTPEEMHAIRASLTGGWRRPKAWQKPPPGGRRKPDKTSF